MGTLHARDRADRPSHLIQGHATRHALQQDVRRIAQQNPGPREHPKADADRDDRIDPRHTGEANGYRPGDDPDRAEHVSPDFEICSFEIRSEEHKSELQSLMRLSYAVLVLEKKK